MSTSVQGFPGESANREQQHLPNWHLADQPWLFANHAFTDYGHGSIPVGQQTANALQWTSKAGQLDALSTNASFGIHPDLDILDHSNPSGYIMSYTGSQSSRDAPFGHAVGEGGASNMPSGPQMHYPLPSETQTYNHGSLGSSFDPNYTAVYDFSQTADMSEQSVVQPRSY